MRLRLRKGGVSKRALIILSPRVRVSSRLQRKVGNSATSKISLFILRSSIFRCKQLLALYQIAGKGGGSAEVGVTHRSNGMAIQTFLLIVTLFSGSALAQEFNGECYVEGKPRRCEPVRMSFSLGQVASASSTCGALPTPFCVRSTILGRISSECSGGDICDANDPVNAHPPLYLTDFPLTGTYWQSENSLVPSTSVVVDIPLITLAEITVVTFDFHTIKPAGFYLERSTDYGQTYQPYHFFAVSCLSQYGINPDAEVTVSNETIPLCQTVSTPQESGVVSFFPAIDRPSANDSVPGYSENVYRFITATNIRVTLDQHLELGLAEDDPGYYYAIVDINVVGSCQCYGHASACVTDSAGVYECVCSHNTMGKYCDQCLDSYNDVPWQRADGSAFECKCKLP